MLKSNGRPAVKNNNYHMTLTEFKLLIEYVREHCGLEYVVLLMLQYTLGMRASEVVSIHALDFSDNFHKITYRSAKTNEIFHDRPVVEPVAELVRQYLSMEGFRCRGGFLFPSYIKLSNDHMTAHCYEVWFWRIRQEIAKIHPSFDDNYPFVTEAGRHTTRYRINTHSIRRLNRTTIKNNVEDVYTAKELCDYKKFDTFQRYLNVQDIHQKRQEIFNAIFDPICKDMMTGNSAQSRLNHF